MARLGYIADEFGRFFVPKPARRSPLINRGYYIRAAAVRLLVSNFLERSAIDGVRRQIVSLGAGFDTTFFWLAETGQLRENDVYYEVDFGTLLARKRQVIDANVELHQWIEASESDADGKSERSSPSRQRRRLRLVDGDLADIVQLEAALVAHGIAFDAPTLLLSECVITYMDHVASSRLIEWCARRFTSSTFVLYEQTHPHDAFGQVMVKHFHRIGSPLQCIERYPTLQAYEERFVQLGWASVELMDMNELYYHALSLEERRRISRIEPFDEFEEWHLKCAHYFVLVAVSQALSPTQASSGFSFSLRACCCNSDDTSDQTAPPFRRRQVQQPLEEPDDNEAVRWRTASPEADSKVLKRYKHAAEAVDDELMVVFGGWGGSNKQRRLADLVVVRFATLECEPLTNVHGFQPVARLGHSLTRLRDGSGRMVLYGGREGPSRPLSDVHVLEVLRTRNGLAARWQQLFLAPDSEQAPASRWRHSATAIEKNRVLVCGCHHANSLEQLHVLAVEGEHVRWTTITSEPGRAVPSPRHSHTMTLIESGDDGSGCSRLVMIGGLDQYEQPCDDAWLLEIQGRTATWQRVELDQSLSLETRLLLRRYSHQTVLLSAPDQPTRLLLVGGVSDRCLAWHEKLVVMELERSGHARVQCLSRALEPPPVSRPSAADSTTVPMWVNHTATRSNRHDMVVVVGGGGNCFSFGSHFDEPFVALAFGWNASSRMTIDTSQPSQTSQTSTNEPTGVSRPPPPPPSSVRVVQASSLTQAGFLEILEQRQPVVIKGNAFGSARTTWSAEYLSRQCGSKRVSVHVGREAEFDFVRKNFTYTVMAMSELVQRTLGDRPTPSGATEYLYLRSLGENARKDTSDLWHAFPEIAKDFELPSFVPEFVRGDAYFSSVLRIGSRGMRLWTHYDVMDNVLCQVSGTKRVWLWPPHYAHCLYLQGSSSEVVHFADLDHAGQAALDAAYPLFRSAPCESLELEAGDMLFLPAMWFHNVLSLEAAISVNIFWRHLPQALYAKKDLFGNADLAPAAAAFALSETIESHLTAMPEDYRDFYTRLLMSRLSKHLSFEFATAPK